MEGTPMDESLLNKKIKISITNSTTPIIKGFEIGKTPYCNVSVKTYICKCAHVFSLQFLFHNMQEHVMSLLNYMN